MAPDEIILTSGTTGVGMAELSESILAAVGSGSSVVASYIQP
jgi:hypothetical protein